MYLNEGDSDTTLLNMLEAAATPGYNFPPKLELVVSTRCVKLCLFWQWFDCFIKISRQWNYSFCNPKRSRNCQDNDEEETVHHWVKGLSSAASHLWILLIKIGYNHSVVKLENNVVKDHLFSYLGKKKKKILA